MAGRHVRIESRLGGGRRSRLGGIVFREQSHQRVVKLRLANRLCEESIEQPLHAAGLVPTTYKSFYYDMTKSVDLAQWPSSSWVDKFDEYYWITQAPEDLPPMPPG